jgi:hypothetical protein
LGAVAFVRSRGLWISVAGLASAAAVGLLWLSVWYAISLGCGEHDQLDPDSDFGRYCADVHPYSTISEVLATAGPLLLVAGCTTAILTLRWRWLLLGVAGSLLALAAGAGPVLSLDR